jgi:hypothetical protein
MKTFAAQPIYQITKLLIYQIFYCTLLPGTASSFAFTIL